VKLPNLLKSALLFAASMPLLPSAGSADVALAIGSQSRAERAALTLASDPVKRLVTNRQLLGWAGDAPAESPQGNGAAVVPLSVQRAVDLHNPTMSTFLVTFAPGGSVLLHAAPSPGYVLVHVLSGALTAWAWEAEVGIYRSGETWAEPAFAYDIATRNASSHEPAEALVVVITEDAR
jgi:hypothetical protein